MVVMASICAGHVLENNRPELVNSIVIELKSCFNQLEPLIEAIGGWVSVFLVQILHCYGEAVGRILVLPVTVYHRPPRSSHAVQTFNLIARLGSILTLD